MNSKEYKGRQITIEFAQGNERLSNHVNGSSKKKIKSVTKTKTVKIDQDKVETKQNGSAEKKKLSVKEKKKLRKSKKKYQKEVEKGISLFVKNFDHSTTQEQLREYFKKHGDVAFVKLKKDSENKNKGFAFIKFKDKQVVDKLATLSSEYWKSAEKEQSEHIDQIKSQLQFNGQTLAFFKTIAKEQSRASKNKQQRDQIESSKSSLISFGLTLPSSDLLYPLTPSSISTREKLLSEKQQEFASNPKLWVSKCHLRLFNLDSRMTEVKLRELLDAFISDWREESSNTKQDIISELSCDGAHASLRVKNKKLAKYLIFALNGFVVGKNPDGLIVDYALDLKASKGENKHSREDDRDRRDKRIKKRQLKRQQDKQQEQKITIDKILDIEQLREMARKTNSREKKKRILKRIQAIQDGTALQPNNSQPQLEKEPKSKEPISKKKSRKRKHQENNEPVSETAMSFEERIKKRAKTKE